MSNNHTIVVDGKIQQINLSDAIDLTNKKHVDEFNKARRMKHKKYISIRFSIVQKPLGDLVDKFTTITGIKWLIKKIFKECGCEKRRQYLNKWNIFVPFVYINNGLSQPKDLQVQELSQEMFYSNTKEEVKPISRDFTKSKQKPCNCGMKNML